MPLIKRLIEPVDISRTVVPSQVNNELEFVSNGSLAHIMRQLASLSAHAEDLFSELHRDAACLLYRVGQLTERVDRVKGRIAQLNPVVEEVLLQDINMRKPFRSSIIKEQQIITRATRPQSVTLTYQQHCEPPPALHLLNQFREDGRDSVKFYTDPGYFLELWCLEMAKNTENQMMKKNRQKAAARHNTHAGKESRSIRAPKSQRANYADLRHGPEFVDNLRRENCSAGSDSLTRQSSDPKSPKSDLSRSLSLHSGSTSRPPAGPAVSSSPPAAYVQSQQFNDVTPGGYNVSRSLSLRQPAPMTVHHLQQHQQQQSDVHMPFSASGIRPSMPPPAPPGSAVRQHLPSPVHHQPSVKDRLAHLVHSPTDLPSPPQILPPSSSTALPMTSAGIDRLPSPPCVLTPPPDVDLPLPSPSFLPPPPLVFGGDGMVEWQGCGQADMMLAGEIGRDTNSDSSSLLITGRTEDIVRDTRSDLLAAIREGIQLRKVERRQKSEQKQQQQSQTSPPGGGTVGSSSTSRLDVQAIMEAAFELRRKALEENDSDDDDVDGSWSDHD